MAKKMNWIMTAEGLRNTSAPLPVYPKKPFSENAWIMGESFPEKAGFRRASATKKPFAKTMWRIVSGDNDGFPYKDCMTVSKIPGAFFGASALTRIRIPESVKFIGATAFSGTSLTHVRLAGDCGFSPTSFPEGCAVSYYDNTDTAQLYDKDGRAVLDKNGARIFVRKE